MTFGAYASTGLIERLPHSNTYALTPDGIRVAVFFLPNSSADSWSPARPPRTPQRPCHHRSTNKEYVTNARLGAAA